MKRNLKIEFFNNNWQKLTEFEKMVACLTYGTGNNYVDGVNMKNRWVEDIFSNNYYAECEQDEVDIVANVDNFIEENQLPYSEYDAESQADMRAVLRDILQAVYEKTFNV